MAKKLNPLVTLSPCHRVRAQRGSALIMAIVVSVVVTSVVMVIAWNSATMVQATSNYMKQGRANYVAEGALQRAYWRFKKDSTYRADTSGSPPTALMTGTDTIAAPAANRPGARKARASGCRVIISCSRRGGP